MSTALVGQAASVGNAGGGSAVARFLSDPDEVERILGLILSGTGNNRRRLLDSVSVQDLENVGSTEPGVYLALGAMLAASRASPVVVQFYTMKANAVRLLLDSGNAGSATVQGDATTTTVTQLAVSQAPGDVAWRALGQAVTTAQITDLLLGCQEIALTDDLQYSRMDFSSSSSSSREGLINADVAAMMSGLGLPLDQSAQAGAGDVVIYVPSAAFRACFAAEVASTGAMNVQDVTVSLVATFTDPAVAQIQTVVFYTARLQRSNSWARCFLCDERNFYSSETDSAEGSSRSTASSESSAQQNFIDSERYVCLRTSEAQCGGFSYAVHLSEFSFTKGCERCGAWVTSCPEHSSQADAFASEQATLRNFEDDGARLRAAEAGAGKVLLDRLVVPNRKVVQERRAGGAASSEGESEEYNYKTFEVRGASVVIPVRKDRGEL